VSDTQQRRPTATDGAGAAETVSPSTVDELAEALRSTSGTVLPVGGGTKMGWAAAGEPADLLIHTGGLDRVVEYEPGDLVIVAEAGVPLAVLQQQVAEQGQMLALDPPEVGATLGGIVSANASGPRRLRYGTVRDLLIGVTVVLADGTVANSGGKVVKNVAGYDLGKLYTGAHGGLGVVASTTWRLHPRPPATSAVRLPVTDGAHAGRLAAQITRSTLTPTAVELRWGDDRELVVLFESTPASVEAQSKAAIELLGAGAASEVTPDWFGARPTGDLVLRIAFAPYDLPQALAALPPGASGSASACTGVGYFAVPAELDLAQLRAAIQPFDGSAVVLASGRPLPAGEHWGPVPDSFDLMTRVKDRFDPKRRLSPGRLLGGM
jgi:glycolate oxidase FAD binding subunit